MMDTYSSQMDGAVFQIWSDIFQNVSSESADQAQTSTDVLITPVSALPVIAPSHLQGHLICMVLF